MIANGLRIDIIDHFADLNSLHYFFEYFYKDGINVKDIEDDTEETIADDLKAAKESYPLDYA